MLNQESTALVARQDLTNDTLVLILAGGRGSRLYELTDKRAKPAVYFGGSRRIIDFALSNCINSNLLKIGVITNMQHTLCCAIYNVVGHFYLMNVTNILICYRHANS